MINENQHKHSLDYHYDNPQSSHNLPSISSYKFKLSEHNVQDTCHIFHNISRNNKTNIQDIINSYNNLFWLWYAKVDNEYLITLIADYNFDLLKEIKDKSHSIDINSIEQCQEVFPEMITNEFVFFHKYAPIKPKQKSELEHLKQWYDLGGDFSKYGFEYRIEDYQNIVEESVFENIYNTLTELLIDNKITEQQYYDFCYQIKDDNILVDEMSSLTIFLNTSHQLYNNLTQNCHIDHIKNKIEQPNKLSEKLIYCIKSSSFSLQQPDFDFRCDKLTQLINYGIDLEAKNQNNWNLLMVGGFDPTMATSLVMSSEQLNNEQIDYIINNHKAMFKPEGQFQILKNKSDNMNLYNKIQSKNKKKNASKNLL